MVGIAQREIAPQVGITRKPITRKAVGSAATHPSEQRPASVEPRSISSPIVQSQPPASISSPGKPLEQATRPDLHHAITNAGQPSHYFGGAQTASYAVPDTRSTNIIQQHAPGASPSAPQTYSSLEQLQTAHLAQPSGPRPTGPITILNGPPVSPPIVQHRESVQSEQTISSVSPSAATSPNTLFTPISSVPSATSPPAMPAQRRSLYFEGRCTHCKSALPPNQSFFECLICSSGTKPKSIFCVYCYTTGAAAGGHKHDKSYLVSDSDPVVCDPGIPEHHWRIHSNAAKRLWYEHRATGLKTYIKPMTAVVHGLLPQGWQEIQNPDGRTYYFNAAKGTSSWMRPGGPLPAGWKESKTPDGVSFYIHDELQLCTWTKPGQQPPTLAPVATAAASPTATAKPTSPSPTNPSAGSTARTSKRKSFTKAAFSKENVGFAAKLASSAVEIGSDPIYGSTKMVMQTVRFAVKKVKNGTKKKRALRQFGPNNGAVNLASGTMTMAGGVGVGLDVADVFDGDDDGDDDDDDDNDLDNENDNADNNDDYDGDAGDQQDFAGLDSNSLMLPSPPSPTGCGDDEGGDGD